LVAEDGLGKLFWIDTLTSNANWLTPTKARKLYLAEGFAASPRAAAAYTGRNRFSQSQVKCQNAG
jgi:hypothetical protein